MNLRILSTGTSGSGFGAFSGEKDQQGRCFVKTWVTTWVGRRTNLFGTLARSGFGHQWVIGHLCWMRDHKKYQSIWEEHNLVILIDHEREGISFNTCCCQGGGEGEEMLKKKKAESQMLTL